MMKEEDKSHYDADSEHSDAIYTKCVRAGKRTYFFDVKASCNKDLYITITERKKRNPLNGKPFFEKHQIFLYKEDFAKFQDSLNDLIKYATENNPCLEPITNEELS
jgi:hypothetical protein